METSVPRQSRRTPTQRPAAVAKPRGRVHNGAGKATETAISICKIYQ